MHGIHPYDKKHVNLTKRVNNKLDTSLMIPNHKFKFPADFAVYDDKISYMRPSKKWRTGYYYTR